MCFGYLATGFSLHNSALHLCSSQSSHSLHSCFVPYFSSLLREAWRLSLILINCGWDDQTVPCHMGYHLGYLLSYHCSFTITIAHPLSTPQPALTFPTDWHASQANRPVRSQCHPELNLDTSHCILAWRFCLGTAELLPSAPPAFSRLFSLPGLTFLPAETDEVKTESMNFTGKT